MSTIASYPVRDSATMLRRNLRRSVRYPVSVAATLGTPLVFLLLFVGVLGETMGTGLLGDVGGRSDYLAYITPGILLISVAGAAQSVAIAVAMDMTEGIVNRFRTMSISRSAVLVGHVVSHLLQTVAALVLVILVALLLGYRPSATPIEWVAALGLLTLISVAIIWLSVAMGMSTKSVESASNLPLPLLLLPFFGSGFVPTESLPTAMRWFAEYQPFTPMMETLRGLLSGTPIGSHGVAAVAWSVAIGLLGHLWARHLYDRDPTA